MNPMQVIELVNVQFQKKVLEEIPKRVKQVELVSHYTTFPAFASMIVNNELWLSHHSYLNDLTEIEFGVSVIQTLLSRSGRTKKLCKVLETYIERRNEFSLDLMVNLAFIFSLTELQDDVAPWNAYGNGGNGIALRFIAPRFVPIVAAMLHNMFAYFPVQYCSEDLQGLDSGIPDFVTLLLGFYTGLEQDIEREDLEKDINFQTNLYLVTKLLASFIKHTFHKSEKEWRLVVFSGRGAENVDLIPKDNGAKMIYKLNFGKTTMLSTLLDGLVLGPKHNRDERVRAAAKIFILKKQNYDRLSVDFSQGRTR